MDRATIDDYIDGLVGHTAAINICYISKISGSRVCVVMKNVSEAEKLVNKVVTGESFALKNKGIVPVSGIQQIRAGATKPGREHILSFRRQVYIKEEDEYKLPSNIQIQHDNVNYWIYLSTDSLSCYNCQQKRHAARQCPEPKKINESSASREIPPKPTENQPTSLERPPSTSVVSHSSQEIISEELERTKEALNTNELPKTDDGFRLPNRKHTFKKRKHEETKTTKSDRERELLKSKETLGHWNFPIDFPKFQIFMEGARNSKNVHDLAANISSDPADLVNIIDALYPYTMSSTLKAQLTRTKNELENQPVTDTENDAGSSSKSDAEML
ncbi:hypothetical protein QAD02_014514 [Eretmocerus hayati]|uniref:Uncharacterized protein n=1 Tax=Eretmocerus hayati TaxID=131215 RepID=A0ACC2P5P2_9HYME|nr:hypothetical protein QAD02_014514 [Eretmocerus hayati]